MAHNQAMTLHIQRPHLTLSKAPRCSAQCPVQEGVDEHVLSWVIIPWALFPLPSVSSLQTPEWILERCVLDSEGPLSPSRIKMLSPRRQLSSVLLAGHSAPGIFMLLLAGFRTRWKHRNNCSSATGSHICSSWDSHAVPSQEAAAGFSTMERARPPWLVKLLRVRGAAQEGPAQDDEGNRNEVSRWAGGT